MGKPRPAFEALALNSGVCPDGRPTDAEMNSFARTGRAAGSAPEDAVTTHPSVRTAYRSDRRERDMPSVRWKRVGPSATRDDGTRSQT